MKLINTTPHTLHFYNSEGTLQGTILPSELLVRLISDKKQCPPIVCNGFSIPIHNIAYTQTLDLPPYEEGVYYIVSQVVAMQNPLRSDLLIPYDLVRDDAGQIIGCRGLASLASPEVIR